MSFDVAYAHLEKLGLVDRVHTFTESTATVELAAEQLGCEPARIAKSMAFLTDEGPILVLAAGDVKVDNRKFRDTFHSKAKMIPGDQVAPSAPSRRCASTRMSRSTASTSSTPPAATPRAACA